MANRVREAFVLAILIAAAPAAAQAPLPEVKTYGDVRVWSGGLGTEEREAMQAGAGEFDVKLVFSRDPAGAFEADVGIVIEQAGSTVLEVDGLGPWVFIDLPPGQYTIATTSQNETFRNEVEAGTGGLRQVNVRFTTAEIQEETTREAPPEAIGDSSPFGTIERRESTTVQEVPD